MPLRIFKFSPENEDHAAYRLALTADVAEFMRLFPDASETKVADLLFAEMCEKVGIDPTMPGNPFRSMMRDNVASVWRDAAAAVRRGRAAAPPAR
jgi:hypothetical protein